MDESTPRPWKVRPETLGPAGVAIYDSRDRWLASVNGDHAKDGVPHPGFPTNAEMDANARLVLRAVNAHDAMVDAMKSKQAQSHMGPAVDGVELLRRAADILAGHRGYAPCERALLNMASEIEAALALAEQE